MADLDWMGYYSGQSTDALIAKEGKFSNDSIISAFNDALFQKMEKIGIDKLTEEERTFLAVNAVDGEVSNGGYRLFFDSSGIFAAIAVDALNRVGCQEAAIITQEAINVLNMEAPNRETRVIPA